MAKFLWHGSYSERGAKALVEQGGTQRCAEVDLIFITFSRKAVLSGVVADPTQRHADSEGQRP